MNNQQQNWFNLRNLLSLLKEYKKDLFIIALCSIAVYLITTIIVEWDNISSAFASGWNSVE